MNICINTISLGCTAQLNGIVTAAAAAHHTDVVYFMHNLHGHTNRKIYMMYTLCTRVRRLCAERKLLYIMRT